LASRFGLPNTTFRRNFPASAADLAHQRASAHQPCWTGRTRRSAVGYRLREHDEALATQVSLIVLTVEHFTVGHVLEEQAPRPDVDAAPGFDMATCTQAYPTVVAAITEYFQHDHTVDDLFRDCLNVIIEGATKSGPRPDGPPSTPRPS
jgi:hypothetical protein